MILLNNSRSSHYSFDPDTGQYSEYLKKPIEINGVGWQYKKVPFGSTYFVALYGKNGHIYFHHGNQSWQLNETSVLKWRRKFPLFVNQFELIQNGVCLFQETYFEPAYREPANYIDFITYDEFDAWSDDFYYSFSNNNMAEWLQHVKAQWNK